MLVAGRPEFPVTCLIFFIYLRLKLDINWNLVQKVIPN